MGKILKINMLSKATSVSGQGVGAAYIEQVNLVKEDKDLFEITENKRGNKFDICHIHTVNPQYYFKMNKKHVNVMYVHFIPDTLDGSIKLPKLSFKIFKKYVISMYRKADEIVVVNPVFKKPLIDLGIKDLCITSDGKVYENLKIIKKYEKQLVKLQRQLSHKGKRSKNYYKTKKKIALCHEKIRNIRKDYLHKVSHEIISENQVIVQKIYR